MSDIVEESVELNTDLKETINEIQNDIMESAELSGDEGESTKTIQKKKKPRSEAQKKALEKAQLMRKKKSEIKKKAEMEYKEDSDFFKQLTKEQRQYLKSMAIEKAKTEEAIPVQPSKPRGIRKPQKVVYEDENDSDEEVVIVRRRKPQKRKPKKVVYEDEYSDESEDEPIVKQIQKPKKKQVEIEQTSEDEAFDEYSYGYQQPLTYSNVARFL